MALYRAPGCKEEQGGLKGFTDPPLGPCFVFARHLRRVQNSFSVMGRGVAWDEIQECMGIFIANTSTSNIMHDVRLLKPFQSVFGIDTGWRDGTNINCLFYYLSPRSD